MASEPRTIKGPCFDCDIRACWFMTSDQEHQIGTHAAFAILAGLCALCVLASLSGCKMTFKTLPCECAQMDMR